MKTALKYIIPLVLIPITVILGAGIFSEKSYSFVSMAVAIFSCLLFYFALEMERQNSPTYHCFCDDSYCSYRKIYLCTNSGFQACYCYCCTYCCISWQFGGLFDRLFQCFNFKFLFRSRSLDTFPDACLGNYRLSCRNTTQ